MRPRTSPLRGQLLLEVVVGGAIAGVVLVGLVVSLNRAEARSRDAATDAMLRQVLAIEIERLVSTPPDARRSIARSPAPTLQDQRAPLIWRAIELSRTPSGQWAQVSVGDADTSSVTDRVRLLPGVSPVPAPPPDPPDPVPAEAP